MGDFEFVVSEGPDKGTAYPFPGTHFYVGASDECHLRFPPGDVQPKHAEIRFDPSGVPWIRDLTGQRLVWLNGEATDKGSLGAGTFLRLGRLELVIRHRTEKAGPSGTMATPTPFRSQKPVTASSPRNPVAQSGARNHGVDATAKRPTPFGKPQTGAGGSPDDGLVPPDDATSISSVRALGSVLTPGSIIDGRYEIVGKLAAGGMGEVYRAQHVELGKAMALKVMLPELSNDPEFVTRFKREAIAASRIGQQNIVDISDFGRTANGRFYFVMEYLDGMTLSSLIHRQGAQPVERVLNIAAQACRALAAAHAQSIVHRDLKPENIMLLQRPGQPDFVKVLDFGVAKVSAGHGQGGHTAVGMVVGTPQYMSPEQAKAVPVDTRSDIYSMALIIYELLTGRPTFAAETPSMLMVKHVVEAPPPFEPGPLQSVPEELEHLVFRMLEKEPAARPQTMEEVIEVLDNLWARLKSNDPSLKRVSGGFQRAATPHRPQSGVSMVRASGRVEGVTTSSTTGLEEPLPPLQKSKLPLVLGGVVVLLLIALGVVGPQPVVEPPPVVVEKPVVDKPVEPKPPVAAARVKLHFTSVPDKADVSEGDILLGVTPLVLHRLPGEVTELTFSAKGHKPVTRKVRFDDEQTIPIELEKDKKATGPGPKKPKQPGLADDPYSQEEDLKDSPF
ncbi:MAG: FHA domain-containing serine/threonine-protein kinase [Archangium sp.]|nr:FHA domain-containing serine/threonine-protein kinase [Archangium sp.]MDP3155888.1 FHA domain-containing serine/threonine-protein kinase [Archangium sp.]MDP3574400.1 FHA domain-containing serine/threonine-protein kinase [Archangium sp.]